MATAPARPSPGHLTQRDTEVRLPRATRVKNKAPSPIQITAEQIIRDARGCHDRSTKPPPRSKIADLDELSEYRLGERNLFEEKVCRADCGVSAWVRYARWEEQQGDLARARSVYERALRVPAQHRDHALWVKYAEFEMRSRAVGHARNVWDRAVALLPRVDQLWSKYAHMEETLGAYANARQVFDRWMAWHPGTNGWDAYIMFETRYGESECARALYEELDAQDMGRAREVYRECLKLIPHKKFTFAKVWIMAAQLEIRRKDLTAARQLLGNAIGMAPKGKIFKKYIEMEMRLGNVDRCRTLYQKYIEWSPANCYAWRKYAELERQLGETDRARSIYELAIAQPALHMPEFLLKDLAEFDASAGLSGIDREINTPRVGKRNRPLPGEVSESKHLKILQAAHRWKNSRE